MRLQLLHPPSRFPSGGNVYNRSLLEAARERAIPLSSLVVKTNEVGLIFQQHSRQFRIWDSLFLEALAGQDLGARRGWGLLLHYLPSQDPGLDSAARRRLARTETAVVQAAELVIVSGRALRAVLQQRHPRRKIYVCEPGVSTPFLDRTGSRLAPPRPTVEMLTVAHLLPAKGLLELLAPLAALRPIPWRWHLVGDADRDPQYTRRFRDTVARLGLEPRIRHHGVLDQSAIAALMDTVDMFVFPSRFEAYGMALAEAAARALPAVSTRVGAADGLYRHGMTGLLAPTGDARTFARHLQRLLSDGLLRQRFRDNLRRCTPRTWQDALDDFLAATSRKTLSE
jgi:glycosyltransferase involved in cell wall biosynthesis